MRSIIANGLALALVALVAAPALGRDDGRHDRNHHHHAHGGLLLAWQSMAGVDGPFLGDANELRGVEGDELPWEIERSASGSLTVSGRLAINVRGLVFPERDPVPPELQGKNDETEFRALVSCLTVNSSGAVVEANVVTQGFSATPTGDSRIRAQVTLPDPCVAPIVMVLAGSEDKWFAATGFASQPADGDDQGEDEH